MSGSDLYGFRKLFWTGGDFVVVAADLSLCSGGAVNDYKEI